MVPACVRDSNIFPIRRIDGWLVGSLAKWGTVAQMCPNVYTAWLCIVGMQSFWKDLQHHTFWNSRKTHIFNSTPGMTTPHVEWNETDRANDCRMDSECQASQPASQPASKQPLCHHPPTNPSEQSDHDQIPARRSSNAQWGSHCRKSIECQQIALSFQEERQKSSFVLQDFSYHFIGEHFRR